MNQCVECRKYRSPIVPDAFDGNCDELEVVCRDGNSTTGDSKACSSFEQCLPKNPPSFDEYDRANPQIYESFRRFALQVIGAGRRRFGAKAVMERIRWDTLISAKDDGFKINNNYTADYARKFIAEFPEYAEVFATRGRA